MTKNFRLVLLCGLLLLPGLAFAQDQARMRIGKVTLRAGMPQEKALQSLRRSHDLSVIEDHANVYLIKEVKLGETFGTVEFKDSKLVSASKNWGRPRSDQLASAPFANVVFDALDDLTGRGPSACTVAIQDTSPANTAYPANPYSRHPVAVYPPPGAALSRNRGAIITCGEATADIGVGTAYFGDTSSVSLNVNYKGPLISGNQQPFFRNVTVDGYKGPIRVGSVTLAVGMPQEKALQLLKGSHAISVTKVPQAPNLGELYFITDVESPALAWSVLFEGSKMYSASKYWILPRSDELASVPFANALFEALQDPTGRPPDFACTLETAVTNPDLHDSATGSTGVNDSLSVIKRVSISCGQKQVGVSISTTAVGNDSSIDIAESIFAK